jgi:hypothetical protein
MEKEKEENNFPESLRVSTLDFVIFLFRVSFYSFFCSQICYSLRQNIVFFLNLKEIQEIEGEPGEKEF